VLNLPHTATDTDIKASYRQLAKKYHPDTWSAPCFSDSEKRHATEVFQKFSAAHSLLSDVNKKAEYDRNYKLGLYTHTRPEEKPFHNSNRTQTTKPPPVKPPQTGAPPPLPKGWTTTIDPASGSLYYCHAASGRSSWTHPLSFNTTNGNTHNGTYPLPGKKQKYPGNSQGRGHHHDSGSYHEYSDIYDRKNRISNDPPDTHRSGAFLALFLCPPLGILACYHSIMVNQYRNQIAKITEPRRKYNEEDTLQRQACHHSKKAATYACFGNTLGILFLAYLFLFRSGEDGAANDKEWMKDWKDKDWWPDNWGGK